MYEITLQTNSDYAKDYLKTLKQLTPKIISKQPLNKNNQKI